MGPAFGDIPQMPIQPLDSLVKSDALGNLMQPEHTPLIEQLKKKEKQLSEEEDSTFNLF